MENIDVELGHVRSEDVASLSDGASIDKEDVRPLINSIGKMFKNLEPPTSEYCIYRVRGSLRNLNEASYTPRVISIGPFHHGKKELQTTEMYKERYLYDFIQRANVSLEDLVTSIREWEQRVRFCYAEPIELSSDELVKIILLDGGFIIEYFLRCCEEGPDDKNREALHKSWLATDILYDLILLENQLPFFVLEKLYNLAFSIDPNDQENSFLNIAWIHFSCFNNQDIPLREDQEVKHFTDLLRTFHLPSSPRLPAEVDEEYRYSLSAMELHEAGVKFKANLSQCLFDIHFTNGVLQIPEFFIEHRTESLIRNLMAFEQCYYPYQAYICDYINLMDTLINTAKDVDLLVQSGIIFNSLGENDVVAIVFNNLRRENGQMGYFSQLKNDLRKHCKDPWNSWKVTFKRDYFSTPWRIASTFAAVILLLLTFMQTVNSYISL